MIKAFLFSVLLQASAAHGWVSRGHVALAAYHPPTAGLRMAGGDNEIPVSPELMETDDPCWQNMLDDDCSMGNVYAANFVASKWIKSMPCGKGIEASFGIATSACFRTERNLTTFSFN